MAKFVKVFAIVGFTLAWLFWELYANFDGDPDTWPLTWVIVRYVPAWVTLPAALLLAVWLPIHFWTNYQKKRASREALMANPLPAPVAPVPAPTAADARNRAIRTFIQGLISDAVIAAVGTLVAGISNPGFVMSHDYLYGVGILVAKSVIIAAVSYIGRYAKPPATT
jgi:hypothetical protein